MWLHYAIALELIVSFLLLAPSHYPLPMKHPQPCWMLKAFTRKYLYHNLNPRVPHQASLLASMLFLSVNVIPIILQWVDGEPLYLSSWQSDSSSGTFYFPNLSFDSILLNKNLLYFERRYSRFSGILSVQRVKQGEWPIRVSDPPLTWLIFQRW